MTIIMEIDPTECEDGVAICLTADGDYADYIQVEKVIRSLTATVTMLTSAMADHMIEIYPDIREIKLGSPEFTRRSDKVMMSDLAKRNPGLLINPFKKKKP